MVQYENAMITPENEWVKISLIMSRSFTLCAVCQLSLFSFLILSRVCFISYVVFSFHSTFAMNPRVVHKNFKIYSFFKIKRKINERCVVKWNGMKWKRQKKGVRQLNLRLMFLLHRRLTYIGFDTNIMSCWRRQQQTTIWWWLETIRIYTHFQD
jgi:hypothetical protein